MWTKFYFYEYYILIIRIGVDKLCQRNVVDVIVAVVAIHVETIVAETIIDVVVITIAAVMDVAASVAASAVDVDSETDSLGFGF